MLSSLSFVLRLLDLRRLRFASEILLWPITIMKMFVYFPELSKAISVSQMTKPPLQCISGLHYLLPHRRWTLFLIPTERLPLYLLSTPSVVRHSSTMGLLSWLDHWQPCFLPCCRPRCNRCSDALSSRSSSDGAPDLNSLQPVCAIAGTLDCCCQSGLAANRWSFVT